jgi:ribosome-associated translation inhibitor RaiA
MAMTVPVHLVLKGMPTSEALATAVDELVEKLERVHSRIERCDVLVDVPHQHQRRGRQFHVRIRVAIPGNDVVISHDSAGDHDDPYIAVRDAFAAAERKLDADVARLKAARRQTA